MIFDIYGKIIANKIVFDLPYHDFKRTDQIGVRRVVIDWRTKEKVFEHFVQHLRRVNISNNGVMVMA